MRISMPSALLAVLLLASSPLLASNTTPVGTWKQIDDVTHKPKSIIEISESKGALVGRVVKVLFSEDGPHPLCKECEGSLKNQPVEGMTIMWGVTQDDDVWDGGKILDPKTGKIYKVKLTLNDDGSELNVRGYVGFALLGRTQVWHRMAPEPVAPAPAAAAPAASAGTP